MEIKDSAINTVIEALTNGNKLDVDLSNEYKALDNKNKCQLIHDLRKQGLSQKYIASSLKISPSAVSQRLKQPSPNNTAGMPSPLDEEQVKVVLQALIMGRMNETTTAALKSLGFSITPEEFEIYLRIDKDMKKLKNNALNSSNSHHIQHLAKEASKNISAILLFTEE